MAGERGFPLGGVFEASVDAIAVMSIEGTVTDWNPAAEALFGYAHEAAVGQELAELIIPHALRGTHRDALQRVRDTGEHRVLNRRLEVFAMAADGTLIPIELTITAIPATGGDLFAGFMRDRRSGGREQSLRRSLEP